MAVTISHVLPVAGVLRDAVDDFCDTLEKTVARHEEYEQRLKSFKGTKFSEEDAIRDILTRLSPEKASALIVALMDMDELISSITPEDTKKEIKKIKEYITRFKKIQSNLHTALDGEVE